MKQNWIYAIGVATSKLGPVKIGRTVDVEQRLVALRKGGQVVEPQGVDASALEVLYAAEAEPWMERRLHIHFHRYRVCGEWFALNPAVVPRELKMAIAEIQRKAEARTPKRAVRMCTTHAIQAEPRQTPAMQHMQLFKDWMQAGFSEDQALHMVAMIAMHTQSDTPPGVGILT